MDSLEMRSEKPLVSLFPTILLSQILLEIMNMFQHLLFKLELVFGGKTFLLSMSVDLSLIYLNDIFHSL